MKKFDDQTVKNNNTKFDFVICSFLFKSQTVQTVRFLRLAETYNNKIVKKTMHFFSTYYTKRNWCTIFDGILVFNSTKL